MIPDVDKAKLVVGCIVIGALEKSPRYVDIGLERQGELV